MIGSLAEPPTQGSKPHAVVFSCVAATNGGWAGSLPGTPISSFADDAAGGRWCYFLTRGTPLWICGYRGGDGVSRGAGQSPVTVKRCNARLPWLSPTQQDAT